jgi:nicotinic acid mononucleotide adenylyltransferase
VKVERGSSDALGSLPACDLTLHHSDTAATRVWFLPDLHEDISATELRTALDQGHADPQLLPAPVWSYITKTAIYRSSVGRPSAAQVSQR